MEFQDKKDNLDRGRGARNSLRIREAIKVEKSAFLDELGHSKQVMHAHKVFKNKHSSILITPLS